MARPRIKWGWLRALTGLIVALFTMVVSEEVARPVIDMLPAGLQRLGTPCVTLLLLVLVIVVLWRFVDRRPVSKLGFSLHRKSGDIGFAMGLALVIMGGGFALLLISGQIEVTGFTWNGGRLLYLLAFLALHSAIEEIPLRGYVLRNLMDSLPPVWATVLVSTVFGLLHLGNQHVSFMGILNCALLGVLVGVYYIHKRNLHFPIVFHLFWNYFMGVIFGFPVSGKTFGYALFSQQQTGPTWLTGGAFGFEGSVLLSGLTLGGIIWVHRKYRGMK